MIGGTVFELVEGDLTDQETDAIVNAAHWDLRGGQGVDGRIHGVGGPSILEECYQIGGCPIGDAVITGAGLLKAKHVIHTVGPVYEEGSETEAELLAWAYVSSLQRATENALRTVAFPSLSTGAFCYPLQLAAPVAIAAILGHLRDTPDHGLTLVRMVLYPDEQADAYGIYAHALQEWLDMPPMMRPPSPTKWW